MKKKLLIAGDSFAADWTTKYSTHGLGWVNMLQDFEVTNIAQAGVSEYKIYQQLQKYKTEHFDKIIVCHTSPYRVPVYKHPIHSGDPLHGDCDLIYNDLLHFKDNKLVKISIDFFENFYNFEYALFVHDLIIKKIQTMIDGLHITFFDLEQTDIISFHKIFEQHRGLINHLTREGNIKTVNLIQNLLK